MTSQGGKGKGTPSWHEVALARMHEAACNLCAGVGSLASHYYSGDAPISTTRTCNACGGSGSKLGHHVS